jgi:hypothetical protein
VFEQQKHINMYLCNDIFSISPDVPYSLDPCKWEPYLNFVGVISGEVILLGFVTVALCIAYWVVMRFCGACGGHILSETNKTSLRRSKIGYGMIEFIVFIASTTFFVTCVLFTINMNKISTNVSNRATDTTATLKTNSVLLGQFGNISSLSIATSCDLGVNVSIASTTVNQTAITLSMLMNQVEELTSVNQRATAKISTVKPVYDNLRNILLQRNLNLTRIIDANEFQALLNYLQDPTLHVDFTSAQMVMDAQIIRNTTSSIGTNLDRDQRNLGIVTPSLVQISPKGMTKTSNLIHFMTKSSESWNKEEIVQWTNTMTFISVSIAATLLVITFVLLFLSQCGVFCKMTRTVTFSSTCLMLLTIVFCLFCGIFTGLYMVFLPYCNNKVEIFDADLLSSRFIDVQPNISLTFNFTHNLLTCTSTIADCAAQTISEPIGLPNNGTMTRLSTSLSSIRGSIAMCPTLRATLTRFIPLSTSLVNDLLQMDAIMNDGILARTRELIPRIDDLNLFQLDNINTTNYDSLIQDVNNIATKYNFFYDRYNISMLDVSSMVNITAQDLAKLVNDSRLVLPMSKIYLDIISLQKDVHKWYNTSITTLTNAITLTQIALDSSKTFQKSSNNTRDIISGMIDTVQTISTPTQLSILNSFSQTYQTLYAQTQCDSITSAVAEFDHGVCTVTSPLLLTIAASSFVAAIALAITFFWSLSLGKKMNARVTDADYEPIVDESIVLLDQRRSSLERQQREQQREEEHANMVQQTERQNLRMETLTTENIVLQEQIQTLQGETNTSRETISRLENTVITGLQNEANLQRSEIAQLRVTVVEHQVNEAISRMTEESLRREIEELNEELERWKPCICNVCDEQFDRASVPPCSSDCQHAVQTCNNCRRQHILAKMQDLRDPHVKCPHFGCGAEMDIAVVRSVLSEEEMRQYEERTSLLAIRNNTEHFNCMYHDCGVSLHVMPDRDPIVVCSVCHRPSCRVCRTRWHHSMTCDEFRQQRSYSETEQQSMDLIQRTTKACPRCQNSIEKNRGCQHMTCRCGYEFCWTCNGQWTRPLPTHQPACPLFGTTRYDFQ